MRLRQHLLVVRKLALDEPRHHHEVRQSQDELVLGDRELDVLDPSEDSGDLVHALAGDDPARRRWRLGQRTIRDRETVAAKRAALEPVLMYDI